MKTNLALKSLLAIAAASAALSLTSVATAGPGVDYWRRMSDAKTAVNTSSREASVNTVVCTGSRLVPITETKNGWANGRGPLVTTTTGTKRVCNSCDGATTERKRTWLNGKGPSVTTSVGRLHECNGCGENS